jgi:hypothetical protein
MKNLIIILLASLFILGSLKSQDWQEKKDTIFTKSGVIIGGATGSDNSQLTVLSKYNIYGGGGYGILSKHSTNHTYLDFSTKSRIGYSSLWRSQAQCAAIGASLYLKKDNASTYDSHSGGGFFTCEFDNYSPYSMSDNIHFLGGIYSTIKGSIATYPNESAISAVIGNDQIKSSKTYGGYFVGRGYFSDNLGVGTKSPRAKVEIANGDIYISDIDKGIIMKSPDGSCWRGALDNSGTLVFKSIECPKDETTSQRLTLSSNATLEYSGPGQNEIVLDLGQKQFDKISYNIFRTDGEYITSGLLDSNDLKVDISVLGSGIYVIELFDSNRNRIDSREFTIL